MNFAIGFVVGAIVATVIICAIAAEELKYAP